MKKLIVIPDSFKGTISSIDICRIVKKNVHHHFPECEVIAIPIADGGEGTVDCFLQTASAQKVTVRVSDPYGDPIAANYIKIGDNAIVEMAQCAGLPLVEQRLNPACTTTYGVGEIMLHAIQHGAKKIMLGLGGSCTNDAGAGMAAALGAVFYQESNTTLIPTGNNLSQVSRIEIDKLQKQLQGIEIVAMCDINNPMYGPNGAAYMFAPQKGADQQMVIHLDNQLRAFAQTIQTQLHKRVDNLPGAGAAGAMGAGVVAFLNGTLQSGIQTILDFVNFDTLIEDADMILTGEGKLDAQSLHGKVVIGVAQRAKLKKVPVVAIVGAIDDDIDEIYQQGISAVFSINQKPIPFSRARLYTQNNLCKTVDNLMRFAKSMLIHL